MSQRGGRPIDFQAWAQNQIVKRAVAALEARDEAFAERNADTPLPQLARYLSRCAISLGHSPSPSEVDGGTFIEQRFGSWAAAMAAAKLPQPRSMRKLRDTARYKAEKVKQEPLFREERRQKRQRKMEQSEQRKREQAAKKRAERAAIGLLPTAEIVNLSEPRKPLETFQNRSAEIVLSTLIVLGSEITSLPPTSYIVNTEI